MKKFAISVIYVLFMSCLIAWGYTNPLVAKLLTYVLSLVALTLIVLCVILVVKAGGEPLCTEENKKKFKLLRKSKTYGKYSVVPRYADRNPNLTSTYSYGTSIKDAIEDVREGKGDFVIDLSDVPVIPGEPMYNDIISSRRHFPFLFIGKLVDREKGAELRNELLANWKDAQFEYNIVFTRIDVKGELRPSHVLAYAVTETEQIGFYGDCVPMLFQDATIAQEYAEKLRQRLVKEATNYTLKQESLSLDEIKKLDYSEKHKQIAIKASKEYLAKHNITLDTEIPPVNELFLWWYQSMQFDIEKYRDHEHFNIVVVQTVRNAV